MSEKHSGKIILTPVSLSWGSTIRCIFRFAEIIFTRDVTCSLINPTRTPTARDGLTSKHRKNNRTDRLLLKHKISSSKIIQVRRKRRRQTRRKRRRQARPINNSRDTGLMIVSSMSTLIQILMVRQSVLSLEWHRLTKSALLIMLSRSKAKFLKKLRLILLMTVSFPNTPLMKPT